MKSLVVYSSQTGNTQKLAMAVFETMGGDKEIFPVSESPDPSPYDIIAVGFWLMAGKPDPAASEFLSKINNGQKVFLFATHGAAADSQHAQTALKTAKNLVQNGNIIGTFNCQGQVNPKVLEKARSKPQPPVWLPEAATAVGHPDEKDIADVKRAAAALIKGL